MSLSLHVGAGGATTFVLRNEVSFSGPAVSEQQFPHIYFTLSLFFYYNEKNSDFQDAKKPQNAAGEMAPFGLRIGTRMSTRQPQINPSCELTIGLDRISTSHRDCPTCNAFDSVDRTKLITKLNLVVPN